MNSKRNIIKVVIAIFILLNLIILVSGYFVIHDIFMTKDILKSQEDLYFKKEDDMIHKLDILKQSNIDLYANIKSVAKDTESLQAELLTYTQSGESSQKEKAFFQNKLSALLQKNDNLKQDIVFAQLQKQNQASSHVKKKTIKRTTRSS